MSAPMTLDGRPYLFRCHNCDEHGPYYNVTGPAGTLSYELGGGLSADGELPPWAVASGYADEAHAAWNISEDRLWQWLEDHYRAMTETTEASR